MASQSDTENAGEEASAPDDRIPESGSEALIEIGVVVAGTLDAVDSKAAEVAIDKSADYLQRNFPGFHFNLSRVRRPEMLEPGKAEPSVLLQQAVEERDARHWDFVLILTAAELMGNYSPFCLAALSRPLDAGVFSMSLIDPRAVGLEVDFDTRVQRVAARLTRLMLHGLAHLTGLPPSDQKTHLLYRPREVKDLDSMGEDLDSVGELEEWERERQRDAFAEIADLRLEEGVGRRMSAVTFSLQAAWINRREIVQAVFAARPWQFPRRLSRLTIASVSTVAILLLTAEAWDLGLSQNGWHIAGLTLGSLLVTTAYVIVRQQLLVRRGRRRSEQTVVTSASAMGIVFLGMSMTWVGLFAIGALITGFLFRPEVIASWAASTEIRERQVDWIMKLQMCGFSASMGLLIGALGASFESQHYFRHVIFVDEEI